jgi:hypothetical protein
MNILPLQDRRHDHWHDQSETNARHFHPGAIQDDPRGCLAQHGRDLMRQGVMPDLTTLTAMLDEARDARRVLAPLPKF